MPILTKTPDDEIHFSPVSICILRDVRNALRTGRTIATTDLYAVAMDLDAGTWAAEIGTDKITIARLA